MRVIAFALFLLLIAEPVYAWLALGRFLIKPVARIATVPLYHAWVKAGRPAWNFVKSPAVLQGATIGLGVVAVGDIIGRFRELEKEATKTLDLQDGKVYRFYCVRSWVSRYSCYTFQGCSFMGSWASSQCYGVPQPVPYCGGGSSTEPTFYDLVYAKYKYNDGQFRMVSHYIRQSIDQCPYGCSHVWVDQYGFCPEGAIPPQSFTINNIPFSTPPIEDDTGRLTERVVDTQVVEQLIRERIGSQVKRDREVFVFPNIPALAERISQEFPNVSQEEALQGLQGVKDVSQVPDFPVVDDGITVEVVDIIDTQTGSRSGTGSGVGSGSDVGSGSQDISIPIPSDLDPSLPKVERLPFPLQLVQSLAQNHPLVRLISGVSVSCGGSCSVPIAFSGGVLSVNAALNFCPFEGVLSFVGSVLLAFVPLIWLFARRD